VGGARPLLRNSLFFARGTFPPPDECSKDRLQIACAMLIVFGRHRLRTIVFPYGPKKRGGPFSCRTDPVSSRFQPIPRGRFFFTFFPFLLDVDDTLPALEKSYGGPFCVRKSASTSLLEVPPPFKTPLPFSLPRALLSLPGGEGPDKRALPFKDVDPQTNRSSSPPPEPYFFFFPPRLALTAVIVSVFFRCSQTRLPV